MTMKRLMLVCMMILCMVLAGCGVLQSKSRDSLIQWASDNRVALQNIVSVPQTAGRIRIDRGQADQWSKLFQDGRLREVYFNAETGDYHLYFNGVAEPIEGDQYLVWSKRPIEDIAPPFPDDPGTLEEKSETRIYWTGIGAAGQGYVLVERIDENLYYVEASYPT